MPAAIIGGVIAAGGAVASASIANKGASKAAAATQQAADTSAQVIRDNYNQSAVALAPWQQSGLGANAMLNDFYGIPQQQQVAATGMGQFGMNDLAYGGAFGSGGYGFPNWQAMNNTSPTNIGEPPNSRDAFRRFIENSDYGFQFGQGANKVNSGYAGAGAIKSGAAMKALEDYRQGLQSGYRGEFLTGLGNQQQVGFGAASAQAGVGQNTANSLSNIYTNQGDNLANAALLRSQNTGNLVNSLATIGAGIFGKKS